MGGGAVSFHFYSRHLNLYCYVVLLCYDIFFCDYISTIKAQFCKAGPVSILMPVPGFSVGGGGGGGEV